jgi:hypothetical protein
VTTATFKTLSDAIRSGYTLPSKSDKDISEPGSYGYDYQGGAGQTTVDVYFTEDLNAVRQKGCIRAMFPPN